ncbi:Mucin-5AC-like 1 [Homarus americanus]|uniref:Mucin-5AC-like 1 n=1 Tax=Homarus americanus TaxID=6706 RepID=A0A8J5N6L6_HOMAM|nr:Mucin-5AC-like 1 [Homarus americanus]
MEFGCTLWCPEGVEFDFPVADMYNCDYATGVWSPSPTPKCDYGFFSMTPIPIDVTPGEFPSVLGMKQSVSTTTQKIKKLPGSCFTWSGSHYKSFDGKVYSFKSSCPYTLLQDSTHGTFTVNLQTEDGCEGPSCRKVIQIFLEDDQYVLQASESGQPSLAYRNTNLAIPGQMNGVVSERVAHYVVVKVSGFGLTIKWDMKNLVVTEISELLWNRTSGLCGRRDGNMDNDWSYADGTQETNMNSYLQAWQAKTLGDQCLDRPNTKHPCGRRSMASEADKFCYRLLLSQPLVDGGDGHSFTILAVVDVEPYINACRWDYCDCDSQDREACACESFAAFYKECTSVGSDIPGGWRSHDLCLTECGPGKVYNPCMSTIQSRCGQPSDGVAPDFCVEGCDCPEGLMLHQDLCIPASDCPCTYRNKEYSAGDTIPNDCNSCTCLGGEWVCTEVKCGSRCAAVGDPHYTTFDGRRFDFMGKCSYYLVQGQDFSIEAENTPCAGAVSEVSTLFLLLSRYLLTLVKSEPMKCV